MKPLLFLIFLFAVSTCLVSQTPQTITMDNNRISAESIKPELQYLFPDFQAGRVILKENIVVKCQLNYNFLLDEMLFIDENGKRMALANPHDVLKVFIGNRLFTATSKGYFEVIENEPISLLYKWTTNIVEKGKEGALGLVSDAPSIYQMNQISFDARTWKLDVDNKAVVNVEVIPYLKIKSNCVLIKGPKDLYKAFPGKRSYIKLYIEQNPVDFRKEADLRRLIKYCNSL